MTRRRRAAVFSAAAVLLALIAGAVIYVDARVFPLEYIAVKLRPTEVPARGEGELRVHALGAPGRSVVLEFPDGTFAMIGAGDGTESSYKKILRYCEGLKIKNLRFLALTSGRSDEVGGGARVLEYLGADRLYIVPAVRERNDFSALERLASGKKTAIRELALGTELDAPDGVEIFSLGSAERVTPGLFYREAPVWIARGDARILLSGSADLGVVRTAASLVFPEADFGGLDFLETASPDRDTLADICPAYIFAPGPDPGIPFVTFAAKEDGPYIYAVKP